MSKINQSTIRLLGMWQQGMYRVLTRDDHFAKFTICKKSAANAISFNMVVT
jgi:hypothetical protein